MEDETRLLFESHHIPISRSTTPDAIRVAVNDLIIKFFRREWRIESSDFARIEVPNGPLDPLDVESGHLDDDPFDNNLPDAGNILLSLPPMESPRYVARVCDTAWCNYLAFVHRFCMNCCKQKYGVEVKRSTIVHPDTQRTEGLGLFATKEFKGTSYICNFATNVKCMSNEECIYPSTGIC